MSTFSYKEEAGVLFGGRVAPSVNAGASSGAWRGGGLSLAAATLACVAVAMLATGVAAADTPDPTGLPQPFTGPPLVRSTPGPTPWVRLGHQPPLPPGSMLLMSDGSVLVHEDDSARWAKLVPDRHGSYVHGHWQRVASLPGGYTPEYFASTVLPDGRALILGGEYNGGSAQVETNQGAVYNPTANTWRPVASPPGWSRIGDAQSTLLDDGRLLIASVSGTDEAVLDPSSLTWKTTAVAGKQDQNNEEGFALLPDGRVLTVDSANRGSELFDPHTLSWSSAGTIPTNLIDANDEQGPLISGPDGSVFAVGGTGRTAVYHGGAGRMGRWSSGPTLPVVQGEQMVAADAAGARLPDGRVLIDVSPDGYKAPTHFFVFNARRLSQADDNATASRVSAYDTRMLVLPTGEVLYDDSLKMYVYRPGGSPRDAWRPGVRSVARRLARGGTYKLAGVQLAGRDQGAAYGDDFQDNTNYPLVRIVNLRSKTVTYARTIACSSLSTASRARSSIKFILPRRTPLGRSTLVVVANGIGSKPVTVTIAKRGVR